MHAVPLEWVLSLSLEQVAALNKQAMVQHAFFMVCGGLSLCGVGGTLFKPVTVKTTVCPWQAVSKPVSIKLCCSVQVRQPSAADGCAWLAAEHHEVCHQ